MNGTELPGFKLTGDKGLPIVLSHIEHVSNVEEFLQDKVRE